MMEHIKQIEPVAFFRSPFTSKFGIPRQSGLAENLVGRIVFTQAYRQEEAVRGLEDFDYLWLIWGFSHNHGQSLTVRPPRLGGNERVGVFASRSPFRPNGLGLSSVRISKIGQGEIEVLGADLMDGTPIYDIKPYIPYADSHPAARGGFTDKKSWNTLQVEMPPSAESIFSPKDLQALTQSLALDPRPHYHHDSERVYGMPFGGKDVRFRVVGNKCIVVEIK